MNWPRQTWDDSVFINLPAPELISANQLGSYYVAFLVQLRMNWTLYPLSHQVIQCVLHNSRKVWVLEFRININI